MLVENGQVNVYRVVIVSHKVLPRLPTGAGGRSSGARLWAGCRLYPVSLHTLCDKQLPPVHSEAINPPENAQPNDAGPSGGDGPWQVGLLLPKCYHCLNIFGILLLEQASRTLSSYS